MKIGLWTWNAPTDQMNWFAPYVDRMKAAGVYAWIPKILDGTNYYNGVRLEPATLYAKQYGLQVYTWGYARGLRYADPGTEGSKLGFRSQALHADAVFADVECEWAPDDPSVPSFIQAIRTGFSGRGPVYFTSYSTERYHPDFPWREFIGLTDGVVPQVYQTPADQWLDKAIADFTALGAKKILPVGLADSEIGSEQVLSDFLAAAEARKLDEVSLWVIDHMTPRMWAILKEHTDE